MEIFSSQKEAEQEIINAITSSGALDAKSFKACGELACQHDSFLKTLTLNDTQIIAYAPYIDQDQKQDQKSKGKKKKKPKQQQQVQGESSLKFAIVLSDSIFFPTGGGQPCDLGTINFTLKGGEGEQENDSVELLVRDAQNIQQTCILYCQPASTSNIDIPPEQMDILHAHQPFLSSSSSEKKERVLSITQNIDWERRFDLMTQHSAQHLCSAVALSQYNIQTHTFSLGETSNYSYIDFNIDEYVSLEKKEVLDIFSLIENQVNQHIRENIPMTPTWLDPNQESDAAILKEKVRSRLLPKNLTGAIRLVEIGSCGDENGDGNGGVIDFNTCCGTHVPSLGHLQMIKFFRMERVKSNIMRVYFAAGKRLMRVMDAMYDTQTGITAILSCTDTEQVNRVEQLLEDKRVRENGTKALKDKLCNFHVKEVVSQCVSVNDDNGESLAVVDLGDVDMVYMTMVANAAKEKIGRDETILVLVGGEDGSDEGSFLLIGNKVVVDQVGKEVAIMFGGRGGGKNGKFQGKGAKLRSALGEVKDFITEAMKTE